MNENRNPDARPNQTQTPGSSTPYVSIETNNGTVRYPYTPTYVPPTRQQKKRLSGRAIFWLVVLAGGLLLLLGSAVSKAIFAATWKGLDPYGTNPDGGTKVIAYNKNTEEFSKRYVPASSLAGSKKEVGFVLVFDRREKTTGAYYGSGPYAFGGKYVSGKVEIVNVTLYDYKTGKSIATHSFESSAPNTISSNASSFSTSVSSSTVEHWVAQALATAR